MKDVIGYLIVLTVIAGSVISLVAIQILEDRKEEADPLTDLHKYVDKTNVIDENYVSPDVYYEELSNLEEENKIDELESGKYLEEELKKVNRLNYSYGNASVTTDGKYRYISSTGIPDHKTGDFPNFANPNEIKAQKHFFRFLIEPTRTNIATFMRIPAIALNGIPIEPGTAEFYNHDPKSGWVEEAFYNGDWRLGIDLSNAHVNPRGSYHYHAHPLGLFEEARVDQDGDLIHLAWAADGFPVYYSQSNSYTSSYKLKEGRRPIEYSSPGGNYDGLYTQDFEYEEGLGNLDKCNGVFLEKDDNSSYVYLITEEFPYFPRCVYGIPDNSFPKLLQQSR